jgi:hypothetical protein
VYNCTLFGYKFQDVYLKEVYESSFLKIHTLFARRKSSIAGGRYALCAMPYGIFLNIPKSAIPIPHLKGPTFL